MNRIAILQARMGSSRLPGKVLCDLAGQPMLARVVRRLRRSQTLDGVIIATTREPADDAIAAFCTDQDWACFRGSQDDVLDRYYQAAVDRRADIVVRITADCPLIEPTIVDRVVRALADGKMVDYACNFLPRRTYPRGLDVEAFSFPVLESMWQRDDNPAWREHVTEYLLHHPEQFRIQGVVEDVDRSHLRWTVDTPEDLEFLRRVVSHLSDDAFSWHDVLALLQQHPEWLEINRHVDQKEVP